MHQIVYSQHLFLLDQVIPSSSGMIHTEATTADGRISMYTTYLHLVRVDESDEGEYQCGFVNEYGSDYSDSAKLVVLGTLALESDKLAVTMWLLL